MANDKHSIGFAVRAAAQLASMQVQILGNNASVGAWWNPQKQELVIARARFGTAFSYDNCRVSADIFFDRTGHIGKVPVFLALREYAHFAQLSLEGFKAICP
jgi:hypothetical protein